MFPAIVYCRDPAARCCENTAARHHGAGRWCLGVAPCPLPAAEAVVPQQRAVGLRRATIPFSSMSQFSLLQIDVDVEEPETSGEPDAFV